MSKHDEAYQKVTDQVIAMLEKGTAPWHQPWVASDGAARNVESGHEYRGINVLLLFMDTLEKGFTSPWWLTYNQAKARGGHPRRGEHGTKIYFWSRVLVKDEDDPTKKKLVPMLRVHTVFNLEQTEDVRLPKKVADWKPGQERENRVEAEAVLANYPNPPKVTETGGEAAYYPSLDALHVPPRATFDTMDAFYSTLFHELGHSTGHESRLNRKVANTFGSHEYGREELVAEMTAAFLAAETGITSTVKNSAAYLQSWINTIREDNRAVMVAAGQAQKAVDHILGRTFEDQKSENGEAA